MRRAPKPRDLSAKEFSKQLKALGIVHDGVTGRLFDLRAGSSLPGSAIRDTRRRIQRRATIEAALAARAEAERARAAAEAIVRHQEQTASRIAKACVGPPRAPLTGEEAIAQLADDFRTAHARGYPVTYREMSLLGWQRAQLDRYEAEARERAYGLENAA